MLGRYIFGEGDHRALRRAISDARRLGDERCVRCSVDNRSAARRNHMRYRMLASDHETTDIRHHHLVPDIDGSADGVSVLITIVKLDHRGIVVEDIPPAEITDRRAQQPYHGVSISGNKVRKSE